MCGIAGIIGLETGKSETLMKAMCDSIAHRGPDAEGLFTDDKVALGHRRLSIIDLNQAADQPLHDISGRYVIVFNGEIYNYKEVKVKLDYAWRTNSDTEVILASYIQWGKDCLQYLNGMFAFAIWDKEEEVLFIARDRIGIKPFYYSLNNGVLVFSSEIRSILKTGLVERKIDKKGLAEYVSRIAVRTPRTIIRNLYQLSPGTYAIFKKGNLQIHSYWDLVKPIDIHNVPKSFDEAKNKVRDLFEQSIKSRMVADVKVGAFLSGGIDSSAVVAAMAKYSDTPVQTYSIVFDEKEYDESSYAKLIAKKYNTEHTEITLKPLMLIEELPSFFTDMDTPTVDGINTYLVSKLVKNKGIKVVLTGLGGDELFAGYPNFIRWSKFKKNRIFFDNFIAKSGVKILRLFIKNRALSKIHDLQSGAKKGLEGFYRSSRSIFLQSEIRELLSDPQIGEQADLVDLNSNTLETLPLLSQYSVGEISNYTLDVLIKDTDQMSMAWALEIREPFFDYKMIEYVLGVPDMFKYDKKTPKNLLVKAMGDLLPPEIVYRPKKGFSFPWDYWLRNELKTYCEESLNRLSNKGVFNSDALMGYWKRFLEKDNRVTWTHIWSFVVLEKWMEQNDITI